MEPDRSNDVEHDDRSMVATREPQNVVDNVRN